MITIVINPNVVNTDVLELIKTEVEQQYGLMYDIKVEEDIDQAMPYWIDSDDLGEISKMCLMSDIHTTLLLKGITL